ncbi:MAG: hypothetical protein ACK5MT_12650 [Actinomycetales bacterium]
MRERFWGRWAVVAVVALAMSVLSATGSHAESAGLSPETARTIDLPGVLRSPIPNPSDEAPEATDPAARLAADTCDGGVPIYGALWVRYTATADVRFLANAMQYTYSSRHSGLAVLNSTLTQVVTCARPTADGGDRMRTDPLELSAGETVYFLHYVRVPFAGDGAQLYLTPTTIPQPNDLRANASVIDSVPFAADFDSTQTVAGVENDCDQEYDLPTHDLWWSFTPTQAGTYRATTTPTYPGFGSWGSQFFDLSGACVNPSRYNTADLQAGQTYLVRVAGYEGHGGYDFVVTGLGTLHVEQLDSTPPVWTKLPTTAIPLGATLSTVPSPCENGVRNSSIPVDIYYRAEDPESGVANYGPVLGTRTRDTAVAVENETACGGTRTMRGYVAVNGSGYYSTVARWQPSRLAVVEQVNMTRSGRWSTVNCACFSDGTSWRSTTAGASLKYRVPAYLVNEGGTVINASGYSIGLVAARGPLRGKAAIYLDGTHVAIIDTYAESNINSTVVWRQAVAPGAHTLTVVNLATDGRPRLDVDAVTLLAK